MDVAPASPLFDSERRPAGRLAGERGIVTSLFVWAIAIFVLLGLVLNESGHIIVAKSNASNAAQAAADAGEEAYKATHDYNKAEAAALQAAEVSDADAQVIGFDIGPDRTVTVTVEVTADTMIVHRISAMKGLAVQRSTVSSSPVSG
jgi:hypothetical protein